MSLPILRKVISDADAGYICVQYSPCRLASMLPISCALSPSVSDESLTRMRHPLRSYTTSMTRRIVRRTWTSESCSMSSVARSKRR